MNWMPLRGVVEPLPHRTGDDEADGERIEEDRAPERLRRGSSGR